MRTLLLTPLPSMALGLTSQVDIAAAPKQVELTVHGMTCATCPLTVRQTLKNQRGVAEARAELRTQTAVITYDPDLVTPAQLARSVTEAGFSSKTKQ